MFDHKQKIEDIVVAEKKLETKNIKNWIEAFAEEMGKNEKAHVS